jgi:hypothetical protein
MPTHAEHAVKRLYIFQFFKTSKKHPKSKDFKKSFGKLQMGSKETLRNFYF